MRNNTLTDFLCGDTLWQQVQAVSKSALATGALKSIPTQSEIRNIPIGDDSVEFQIRVVENLRRKSKTVQQRAKQLPNQKNSDQKPFNPFLPYEPDLYVGELTDHYRCLLNKFNVMDHHILMVTTQFEPQQTPLGIEDFLAAMICLQAQNGLVFYNGGPEAGASVEHKHLQMIPLPLTPLTLDFLWVVPRSKERFQGLAVNALGFSGTLLVKDTEQLNELDNIGCLNLLKAVAFSD